MKPASFALWSVVIAVAGALASSPVRGQSSVSVSGFAGSSHTDRGSFSNRDQWVFGLDGDLAVPVSKPVALTFGVTYRDAGFQGDKVTLAVPMCYGCMQSPPDIPDWSYVGGTVGARFTVYRGVGFETNVGLGTVNSRSRAHTGSSWSGGLMLPVFGPLRLLVHVDVIRWTMDANTLYSYPVTAGLRLRF
jgi:hypothetical protein